MIKQAFSSETLDDAMLTACPKCEVQPLLYKDDICASHASFCSFARFLHVDVVVDWASSANAAMNAIKHTCAHTRTRTATRTHRHPHTLPMQVRKSFRLQQIHMRTH